MPKLLVFLLSVLLSAIGSYILYIFLFFVVDGEAFVDGGVVARKFVSIASFVWMTQLSIYLLWDTSKPVFNSTSMKIFSNGILGWLLSSFLLLIFGIEFMTAVKFSLGIGLFIPAIFICTILFGSSNQNHAK